MSMRSYGVDDVGLVLTIGETIELIEKSAKGLLEKGYIEDEIDATELGGENVYDIITNMGVCYYGEIDGEILTFDRRETKHYLDFEDVVVFELQKTDLFECYKNIQEIYQELLDRLTSLGFNVDLDYVKQHLGRVCGTYVS